MEPVPAPGISKEALPPPVPQDSPAPPAPARFSLGVISIVTVALVLLAGGLSYFFLVPHTPKTMLPTYFTYSDAELDTLSGLSSSHRIVSADVYRSDQEAYGVVASEKVADVGGTASKLYAYLAVAQRDFAFLSYNARGQFEGNFDYLSKDIACIFFEDYCGRIETRGENDAFSQAVAKLVMSKVTARIAEDKALTRSYPRKEGTEFWNGPDPRAGDTSGSSKGWFIESGDQFRVSPPPAPSSEALLDQVRKTKEALTNATPEEKRATVFWAGVPGTKTPPGQILQLGDSYMEENQVHLQKVLLVRSVVALAVADAVTAVFDSKYTYAVKRPFMMDSSIITIMPTPNHPSYPAGHSTLSTAGATVLEHYFPEDKEMWEAKAYEAGMSRVWGGIHYVMDHEAGVILGTEVGKSAIGAASSVLDD